MNKDEKPEIAFWGIDEQDRLSHESLDEAVEEYLEDSGLKVEEMADTLEVIGYSKREIDADGWDCLKDLLFNLDDNYGDPDGSGTDPTEKMKEAEHIFVASVLSEYKSWPCEEATRETIDVKKWIQENRPDWLEEK